MIKFFVSSTFKDMMGERDLLEQIIIPRLRVKAQSLGKNVTIADLRWGIDTDDTRTAVTECLDALDGCNEFIAFIGDYYGDERQRNDVIREIWKSKVEPGVEIFENDYDISVLQLEIEYAFYKAEHENMNLLFYLRNIANLDKTGQKYDGNSLKKLDELKKRIEEKAESSDRIKVITYDATWRKGNSSHDARAVDLNDLQKKLLDDMTDTINRHADEFKNDEKGSDEEPESLHWTERESLISSAVQNDLLYRFVGRDVLRDDIVKQIAAVDQNVFCITGEPACGKSSIIASVYQAFAKIDECQCLYIACNKGERSKSYLDVLLRILHYMCELDACKKSGLSHDEIDYFYTIEKAQTSLEKLLDFYNKNETKKTLVFVIDEIDQTTEYDEESMLRLFSLRSANIMFILSGDFGEEKEGVTYFRIEKLTDIEVEGIIRNTMIHTEESFEQLLQAIRCKEHCDNPLYLSLLINIIKLNGLGKVHGRNNREIYEMYHNIVKQLPERLDDLCITYIKTAAETTLGNDLWKDIIGFMVVSEDGVKNDDLLVMIGGLNREALESFVLYLDDIIFEGSQGRYQFANCTIAESVRKFLIDGEDLLSSYEERFFGYLQSIYLCGEQKDRVDYLSDAFNFSYDKDCFDLAIAVMKRINRCASGNEYEERVVVRNAVKVALDIIEKEDNGRRWFGRLVEKASHVVIAFITLGMEYKISAELERRYPAKHLADILWNELDLVTGEELCEYAGRIQTPEDKRKFVSFCAQYVGVHDDISRHKEAFLQEIPIYEYIMSVKDDYRNASYEEKKELLTNANLVFYSNNKLIRKAIIEKDPMKDYIQTISMDLMKWFEETIDQDPLFAKHYKRAAFLNNIGQYYNAVRDYKKAFESRKKPLRLKAYSLFNDIDVHESDRQEFDTLISQEIDISQHRKYWEDFYKKYSNAVSEEKSEWNAIGVSYRTLATDCYYLPNNDESNGQKYLELGCEAHNLCLLMQEKSGIQEVEKESVVTAIRLMGAKVKLYRMYGEGNLSALIDDACRLKDNVLVHCKYDEAEQNNLKNNINALAECDLDESYINKLNMLMHELDDSISGFME